MAIRGRKPNATIIQLATGRRGRLQRTDAEPMPQGRPSPPVPLTGRPAALWRRYVARAPWLTAADGPKAFAWCHLTAEFEEDPRAMLSARIAQLRALGSELGFDPASRARLGAAAPAKRNAAAKYFSD